MEIGFILKNEGASGQPDSKFAVTIDSAERATGIDFFSLLEDGVENKVEGNLDMRRWFTATGVKVKYVKKTL